MAKPRPPVVHGLAVVDKPAGWTSHDVVAKARGILGERRVGHSGTLDPDATGVLLLGVGSVTRLLRFLTALRKTYTAEIVLGSETNTLDDSGKVTATYDMAPVTRRRAEQPPPSSPGRSGRSLPWFRPYRWEASGCTSWLAKVLRSTGTPGR